MITRRFANFVKSAQISGTQKSIRLKQNLDCYRGWGQEWHGV